MRHITLFCTVALLLSTLGCLGRGEQSQQPISDAEPTAPVQTVSQNPDSKYLFEVKCSVCHSIERAASKRKTYDEWLSTINKMRRRGSTVTDEQAIIIAEYLTATYGNSSTN